ncbi:MAG: hypothetical protein IKR56_04855 [Lachnospiraceae bacterium]|nr:hypothetical protein [Lachnospiraceae bacterium]MBR4174647.1 hypothetical protein [Lachnospiraceae bacterium]
MANSEVFEAAGFSFPTQEQADEALEEEKKIFYIKSRLNHSDPMSVLVIYNKMIKGQVMKTPVGMTFLKELHDELSANKYVDPMQIDSIPFGAAYEIKDDMTSKRDDTLARKNEEIRRCNDRIRICRIIIGAMVIAVIAMFIITMKSDNPNILNYETAIQNKYATWEQDLVEREKAVREKELELGIRF